MKYPKFPDYNRLSERLILEAQLKAARADGAEGSENEAEESRQNGLDEIRFAPNLAARVAEKDVEHRNKERGDGSHAEHARITGRFERRLSGSG